MNTVFLARNRFGGFSFLHVEDLNGFIIAGGDHMLTLVVKV
jgi:hypothetical protein